MCKIKDMKNLLPKIKFVLGCITFIKNPYDTDHLLRVGNVMAKNGAEDFDRLFKSYERSLAEDDMHRSLDSLHLEKRGFAPGTLGESYLAFLERNNLNPDFYKAETDMEMLNTEWRIRRHLRSTHDMWHVVTGFGTSLEDEVGLQAFMHSQLDLKFSFLVISLTMIHFLIYKPTDLGKILARISEGWSLGQRSKAFFGVDWREYLNTPLVQVREQLRKLERFDRMSEVQI